MGSDEGKQVAGTITQASMFAVLERVGARVCGFVSAGMGECVGKKQKLQVLDSSPFCFKGCLLILFFPDALPSVLFFLRRKVRKLNL